jgi:hypothetical protein
LHVTTLLTVQFSNNDSGAGNRPFLKYKHMVNYSKKIAQALTIIRKYYGAINVQRTDNEDVVYLFDYTTQKKTIGSESINKAIEKAVKQNDFPKDIYYSEGLLSVIQKQQNEGQGQGQGRQEAETIETDEAVEAEEITEIEKPKKRGRKKQTETELDAES